MTLLAVTQLGKILTEKNGWAGVALCASYCAATVRLWVECATSGSARDWAAIMAEPLSIAVMACPDVFAHIA